MRSIVNFWMLAALLAGSTAFADDEPAKTAPKADTPKQQAEDVYAVPDGDAAALLAFIEKLEQMRPKVRTRVAFNRATRYASDSWTGRAVCGSLWWSSWRLSPRRGWRGGI